MTYSRRAINRRRLVVGGVCVVAGAAALRRSMVGAQAAGFDWRRFDGETIRVFMHESVISPWLRDVKVSEFQELTGITVDFETMSVDNYRTRLPIELASSSSAFDVMSTQTIVEGRKFASAGWYEPLGPFVQDPELTSPDWDVDDFSQGALAAMTIDDTIVTVQYEAQTILLYYLKSLFEEQGIAIPETFEELEAAATALHLHREGVYGIGLRGGGYQATTPFSTFLYGMGGSWLVDGQPALATPEAIEAFVTYGRIGHNYGPPGAAQFTYPGTREAFAQGQLAMVLETNSLAAGFVDPEQSRVADDVGFAVVPGGPAGRWPFFAGSGFALNPFSDAKPAAWYFIQFMTSKVSQLEWQMAGNASPRVSPWVDPAFEANDPYPEISMVNLASFELAHSAMNPPVIAGLEAREIVGVVTDLALGGASPEEIANAAAQANEELAVLIAQTEV